MRALLALQEGPGAGHTYLLDPLEQPAVSVGRSSGCDVTLNDQRASRHHCDLRWNGRQWEVHDRGSTNGTYVNGMQIHGPYELRIGDRITVGETTMVPRELGSQSAAPSSFREMRKVDGALGPEGVSQSPAAGVSRSADKAREGARAGPGLVAAYWLVQAIVMAGIVCLSVGAFLPWLQVTGSLAQDLQPLLQGLADIVAIFSGQDSIFNVSQQINGMEGYGKLTLLVAIVSMIALGVDVLFHRQSAIPAIVYLLSSLMAGGAIAFDLVNYYRFYDQMKDLTLLFGIQLVQVVEVFDQFLDVTVTPMLGLALTGLGLILLLIGAVGRLGVAILDRNR